MEAKKIALALLILAISQLVVVHSQIEPISSLSNDYQEAKIVQTIPEDKKVTPEELTFRSMVRAQNLAFAADNNKKYGKFFTSGETKFSFYTIA